MNNILRDLVSYYVQECIKHGKHPDAEEFTRSKLIGETTAFENETDIDELLQDELATYTLKEEIA